MNKKLKVLVACEESQAVCKEFRKLGHEAYSCDTEPCSGGHPEWHIKKDIQFVLSGGFQQFGQFWTESDFPEPSVERWDMIVAFPPCTHLSVSGAAHFKKKREDGRQIAAIEFFMSLYNADCDMIAIENPVGIMSGKYIKNHFPSVCVEYGLPIKPTQYIQPYEYGHNESKKTGLWLKNLPALTATNIVEPEYHMNSDGTVYRDSGGSRYSETHYNPRYSNQTPSGQNKLGPSKDRSKIRSKTYPGIAKAMAEHWGGKV